MLLIHSHAHIRVRPAETTIESFPVYSRLGSSAM
jgi:hypothetical protein